MTKREAYLSALETMSKGQYHYWNGRDGIGCSDFTVLALRRAGIINASESFWAGQSQVGVLADTSRFERIAWSKNAVQDGDILYSHGHHVATYYKGGLYEAAPESTHSLATCGTGVGYHKDHGTYNCGTGKQTWTCIYRIIENSGVKKMIKSQILKKRAMKLCNGEYGKTVYNNSYPYNVGKWNGSQWSFDCLGFVHTLVNGFVGDKTVLGGGATMDSFVLACNEAATLARCTNVSKFNGTIPKEMALLQSSGHVGFYIGEYKVTRANGTVDVYNAVECTPAWGGGCLYSWVDLSNGYRYNKKGGQYRSIWNYHGELDLVDYSDQNAVEQPEVKEEKAAEETLDLLGVLKLAVEVTELKWGVNPERKEKLMAKYGSDVAIKVQDIINLAAK